MTPTLDTKLTWFFEWRSRGCPVHHRPTGKTYFLPLVTQRIVEKGQDVVIVADQPDGHNNQLNRQIIVRAFPTADLEVDE
jgi:hypothetical protein